MGVTSPSVSPYASPIIIMVKKENSSTRVCADFWKLHKITEVDPEPMTMAEDLFLGLSNKKYLSKIDLTKGYWQIPVAPEDLLKTCSKLHMDNMSFYRCHLNGEFRSYSHPRTENGSRIIVRSW